MYFTSVYPVTAYFIRSNYPIRRLCGMKSCRYRSRSWVKLTSSTRIGGKCDYSGIDHGIHGLLWILRHTECYEITGKKWPGKCNNHSLQPWWARKHLQKLNISNLEGEVCSTTEDDHTEFHSCHHNTLLWEYRNYKFNYLNANFVMLLFCNVAFILLNSIFTWFKSTP